MEIRELLHDKKIKATKPRYKIASVLSESSAPMSLDEIEKVCDDIDFSSVYRTIKLFLQKGIVTEHYFGEKKAKYHFHNESNHNHFIKCLKCGKLEEIKNICIIDEVNKRTAFKIIDHYMEFTGLCPNCSKN